MRLGLRLGLAATLLALGCISPDDPLGHRDALADAQKRYTNMIRWGDAAKAVQFVEPDLREKFMANADALKKLAISDYDLGEIQYADDDKTATVDVTYRGYSLVQLIEREIKVTQEWHRDKSNDWLVRPDLDNVIAQLNGQTP